MSDPITNDWTLNKLAESYAADIAAEIEEYGGEAEELAWHAADSSEHVIYHYKAHSLCQNCNTDQGEEMMSDLGTTPESYNEFATQIAFCELYCRIVRELFVAMEETA